MMKGLFIHLFRPVDFNDPWKYFWDALQILIISMLLLALIFIIPVISMILSAPKPQPESLIPYYSAEKYSRLHRKHGRYYTIIEEPGQVPYYYNSRGQKCKLM